MEFSEDILPPNVLQKLWRQEQLAATDGSSRGSLARNLPLASSASASRLEVNVG
jgi:hypothetical protein